MLELTCTFVLSEWEKVIVLPSEHLQRVWCHCAVKWQCVWAWKWTTTPALNSLHALSAVKAALQMFTRRLSFKPSWLWTAIFTLADQTVGLTMQDCLSIDKHVYSIWCYRPCGRCHAVGHNCLERVNWRASSQPWNPWGLWHHTYHAFELPCQAYVLPPCLAGFKIFTILQSSLSIVYELGLCQKSHHESYQKLDKITPDTSLHTSHPCDANT